MKQPHLKMIAAFVTAIIILSGIFLFIQNNQNNINISALEAKDIAYPIATNWNNNATLVNVRGGGMNSEGYFSKWIFKYIEPVDALMTVNETDCIEIKVYSNGSYESWTGTTGTGVVGDEKMIISWTIDSCQAFEIAYENDNIHSFLRQNPSVYVFSLHNATWEGHSTQKPAWFIEWTYDAGFDDPKWAQILIDANTGEVLYVDVDD